MRLVLIGHACGPDLGSEPGITWNWATHLAADHEVVVIAPPTNRDLIERTLAERTIPNLTFEWVTVPRRFDTWRSGRGWGIRLHYVLWKRYAVQRARDLCERTQIDHVHYLSWNTIGSPPNLRAIPAPTSWGPVGGGQKPPLRFLPYFGPKAIVEVLRALRLAAMPLGPRLRATVGQAAPLLSINDETTRILQRAGAKTITPMLEVGIEDGAAATAPAPRSDPRKLVVLWAGKLDRHKALPLALEALARTTQRVELRIAGSGPQRERAEGLCKKLGIDERVSFLGQLPTRELQRAYPSADVFLFTSLRDSSGGVVFEAMAAGLPVVIPDHQGVRTHVPFDASIRYSLHTPDATVDEIAAALDLLASDETMRQRLGQGAITFARTITWNRKVRAFTEEIAAVSR